MPELIHLQTPDFEFSVWANDISRRADVYHSMLNKRASAISVSTDAEPEYQLRFVPEMELVGSKNSDTSNGPIFFENTQYQFEWLFFKPVTNGRLVHRSQAVNEAFRFTEQTERVPARLTGTINTGNDVGWMRLPLSFDIDGKTHTQYISFEVLPTKMALHQDIPAMYQAIDAIYPLWRFSLVEKTEQDAASSKQRGHFPLMWLANFSALRTRFEQGLKVICAAPHSRLQSTVTSTKAAKLKGLVSHKLAEKVTQDFANGQYDKRYRVEKKKLSLDTPENCFIKMAVTQSKRQLADFEKKLRDSNKAPDRQRLSDAFLSELHNWQQPLQKVLDQSFLKDVGTYTGLSRESLVLQQKTGYSAVYRVWQELKFYLDAFGRQSNISMKSVAEIYEVWCFLCLKQILEHDLGFELVENSAGKLSQNAFFEYQLKDGFAGAFRFSRADGVTARLAHEPKFTYKGKSIRSYSVAQEPDIVLEVTLPKSGRAGEEKQFIWLFDAKYRIKTEKNRFDDINKDIDTIDYAPDDAINQMHRYRDALIHLSGSENKTLGIQAKKSRPVFGAFALYPGFFDQNIYSNPYEDPINEVGIGAFALLPSQIEKGYCGHRWLLDFLQEHIGVVSTPAIEHDHSVIYPMENMAERLYAREPARIPYSGMHQVLYPDLIMTAALAGQRGRNSDYFEAFEKGTAQWYHLPKSTFSQKFKQHIAEEICYLALASTSDMESGTKQIDKIWPVKQVSVVPRNEINARQAGKSSTSTELFYLFELGKPLTLQHAVLKVPHRPIRNSMKLTTLTRLERVVTFAEVEKVYGEATNVS